MATVAETLEGLAVRCESAAGPDREIDCAIYHDVLGFCRHSNTVRSGAQSDTGFDCLDCGADSWGNKSKKGGYPIGQRLYDATPAYTASIDAAMTLVPEGGFGSLICGFRRDGEEGFVAVVTKPNRAEGEARTKPLALCAAALRAAAAKAREVRS